MANINQPRGALSRLEYSDKAGGGESCCVPQKTADKYSRGLSAAGGAAAVDFQLQPERDEHDGG